MDIKKLLVMWAGALIAVSSQAESLIDLSFDAVTPGVYSNLNVYTSTTFGAKTATGVTVASITTNGLLANGSDYALKLGGAGAPAWSMTFGAAATGLTNGVFSMSFAASSAVNINLGGSGNTTAQLQLLAASDNRFGYREIAGGTTNWVYFDQTWTKNAEQSLQVTFNNSSDTFTAKLNGTALTIGAADTFGLTRTNLGSIGDVTLTYSTASTTFYVDDLKLSDPVNSATLGLFTISFVEPRPFYRTMGE